MKKYPTNQPSKKANLPRRNKTGKLPVRLKRLIDLGEASVRTGRKVLRLPIGARTDGQKRMVAKSSTIKEKNPSREKAPTTTGRNPLRGSRKKDVKNPK